MQRTYSLKEHVYVCVCVHLGVLYCGDFYFGATATTFCILLSILQQQKATYYKADLAIKDLYVIHAYG